MVNVRSYSGGAARVDGFALSARAAAVGDAARGNHADAARHGAASATMHHTGAIPVTGNGAATGANLPFFGVLTMQINDIDGAIRAFLNSYQGDNAKAVAVVVQEAKRAADARKGMQESLFSGFLALAATGASITEIRQAGAIIREDVRRVMREAAGLPAVKAKGAKESKAPDFSTASVYAKLVSDMLSARREHLDTWQRALESFEEMPLHPQVSLPATVGASRRALAKFGELLAPQEQTLNPAIAEASQRLWGPSEAAQAATREDALKREIAELRDLLAQRDATLAAMRQTQRETAQA
jgi:hypothetical protein